MALIIVLVLAALTVGVTLYNGILVRRYDRATRAYDESASLSRRATTALSDGQVSRSLKLANEATARLEEAVELAHLARRWDVLS
ncbi:hypothetical protein LCGC14_2185130 [marine sediment metagenome]|uniref:Uncharacterized protein n=1 Tax=marine sediment metagenome TaxID=412755 RepID=A0A0F9E881_9ZZZZ